MRDNTPEIIARGSPVRRYAMPIIGAGATSEVVNVVDKFPELRTWEPFDSLTVQNNSAQNIEIYLNGDTNDVYFVPAYMIQPIMRRWYRSLSIKNDGGAATVAGDIQLEFRRLSPDITPTVNVS
jgi:hypothetical protein